MFIQPTPSQGLSAWVPVHRSGAWAHSSERDHWSGRTIALTWLESRPLPSSRLRRPHLAPNCPVLSSEAVQKKVSHLVVMSKF